MKPLNPFILKEKRKLLEGMEIGDEVEICWKFGTEMCLKGKIVEMTDWIGVKGDSYSSLPITALTSARRI